MAKKSKYWKQAPLPFTGQKRYWISILDNELDKIDLSGIDTIKNNKLRVDKHLYLCYNLYVMLRGNLKRYKIIT